MIRKGWIIILVTIISLAGCRDEFDPEIDDYDNLLVVDGLLTNEEGPYTIRLSRTASVDKPDYNPLSGCTVKLHENTGYTEELTEVDSGVYQTAPDGLQTQIGNSYKLSVNTPDGETYESDFIELREPVGIQSITHDLEFHETNEYPKPLPGYQFFVSTEAAQKQDAYFLWRMMETYEYTSEFRIHYIYRGMGIEEFLNNDTLYRCWKTAKVPEFFTGSTQALNSTQVKKKPLHFVSTEGKRIQVRYSLLLKQFTISSEAYHFWTDVREQVTGDDFLFSSQPYPIRGNMRNVDDSDDIVLGYFTVGSVAKNRIFVDRPEDVTFYYQRCVVNTDLRGLGYLGPDDFPVYLTNSPEGIGMASEYCFDCTLYGGKLNKPAFWVDK